jgi:hypothetical protein
MKTDARKLKMSITFDEFESMVIREAAKKVCGRRHADVLAEKDVQSINRDYRRIVAFAVLAYCRGVVMAADKIPDNPVIAECFRTESKAERDGRCLCMMPGQSNKAAAFAALAAKNEWLANHVKGKDADEVKKFLRDREVRLAVYRGEADQIKDGDSPFGPADVAEMMQMDSDDLAAAADGIEDEIEALREYMEMLDNPEAIGGAKTDKPALNAAEMRYCEAEGISPADFIKKKSSR